MAANMRAVLGKLKPMFSTDVVAKDLGAIVNIGVLSQRGRVG
jgi:hypothetical protein